MDRPDGWQIHPASEDGDYVTFSGPRDVTVQVRTLPGTKEDVEEAMQEGLAFLKEHFKEPGLVDTANLEHRGMPTFVAEAKGIDANGQPKRILMYFVALDDETLVGIWYAIR